MEHAFKSLLVPSYYIHTHDLKENTIHFRIKCYILKKIMIKQTLKSIKNELVNLSFLIHTQ